MQALLDQDAVHPDELKKCEQAYLEQLRLNGVASETARTHFEYAWCLVRSKFPADIKRGIVILEGLSATGEEQSRGDYLYNLAVANTKLSFYTRAHECCNRCLALEPSNQQAQELLELLEQRMITLGLKGLAVTALVVIIFFGLGMAMAKK